jgi:hypothetical protein
MNPIVNGKPSTAVVYLYISDVGGEKMVIKLKVSY